MANAADPCQDHPHPPTAKLTIRVYRVNRYGIVTYERGTLAVLPVEGPPPLTSAFPPCKCPACRTEEADAR
ncbi:hypothetical protein [Streptomyces mexicanus]|jgi:hypothetical protein|uniref:hypothetical protein n=1 Tax=Streptomyces mexicanus TaxID=178566 RepID=UPI0031E65ACA